MEGIKEGVVVTEEISTHDSSTYEDGGTTLRETA